jgi:hypothetical protein
MEPEGSLPGSQEPAIGPYPNQINPIHTSNAYFPKFHFNIILPSTPRSSDLQTLQKTFY